jgi:uncharacterized protein YbcI
MATCFGYIIAILRPTQNSVQVHKVRTQWDPISFTNRDIYIHKIGTNIVKLASEIEIMSCFMNVYVMVVSEMGSH